MKIFNDNDIRRTAQGFHNLNLIAKIFRYSFGVAVYGFFPGLKMFLMKIFIEDACRVRRFLFIPLKYPLGHRNQDTRLRLVTDLDDLEGRLDTDSVLVPVNLKNITKRPAAEPFHNMPLRPEGFQFFFNYPAFNIVYTHFSAFPSIFNIIIFLKPASYKPYLKRPQKAVNNSGQSCC